MLLLPPWTYLLSASDFSCACICLLWIPFNSLVTFFWAGVIFEDGKSILTEPRVRIIGWNLELSIPECGFITLSFSSRAEFSGMLLWDGA